MEKKSYERIKGFLMRVRFNFLAFRNKEEERQTNLCGSCIPYQIIWDEVSINKKKKKKLIYPINESEVSCFWND